MAILNYKSRDFVIYQHLDQPGIDVTQNGYNKKVKF